jgi:hypothetical protein
VNLFTVVKRIGGVGEMTKEQVNYSEKFGMSLLNTALRSNDFGWTPAVPISKQYILTNAEEIRNSDIDLYQLVSLWRGTGHVEWEYIMAGFFLTKVIEVAAGEEVNISQLFNKDMIASRDRVFTKEQAYEHLIKWFTVVNEDESNIYLSFNLGG